MVSQSFVSSFVASLTYEILFRAIKNTSFVRRILSHPFVVVLCKKLIMFAPLLIL